MRLPQSGAFFESSTGGADVESSRDDEKDSGERPGIGRHGEAKPDCILWRVRMERPEKARSWQQQQTQRRAVQKSGGPGILERLSLHAGLHGKWHSRIELHGGRCTNTW